MVRTRCDYMETVSCNHGLDDVDAAANGGDNLVGYCHGDDDDHKHLCGYDHPYGIVFFVIWINRAGGM